MQLHEFSRVNAYSNSACPQNTVLVPESYSICQTRTQYTELVLDMPDSYSICQTRTQYARLVLNMPDSYSICQTRTRYTRLILYMPDSYSIYQTRTQYARLVLENSGPDPPLLNPTSGLTGSSKSCTLRFVLTRARTTHGTTSSPVAHMKGYSIVERTSREPDHVERTR